MPNRLALALAAALAVTTPLIPISSAVAAQSEAKEHNPLLYPSELPYQMPAFDKIRDEHFKPALLLGMQLQEREVNRIAKQKEAATFDNTILALERSGEMLTRASSVFGNLTGANTNETLQKIEAELAPLFAAHADSIVLNGPLFDRIQTLYDQRATLDLDDESRRLIERYYIDFVRAGAKLSPEDKTRLKALNAELATLDTAFQQNLLKETNAAGIEVKDKARLAGLSDDAIAAAAEAAKAKGMKGSYFIALQNTSGQPALARLHDRELRRQLHEASLARGSRGGEFDNRELVLKIAKLRAERAKLLGYPTHAAYVLEDATAKSVSTVNKLLADLAPAAVANAKREAAEMQALIDAEGGDFQLASWDWAYYAEKLRQQRYAFDESQLRPYFELENVLQNGVFYAANQLYGISFKERKDLPVYHPDVRVFEVFDADGEPLALFLADFYARPSKRGGAWMNEYVSQSKLTGNKPVVANHQNIPKPSAGQPTLLSFDEVNTMFHEFGHALHGMFSNVGYPRFAGTSVPTDFVEYPSQVNEMWATWPAVLKNYAKHYKTGEPIPQDLLDKVLTAEKFNQGFATTEYLGAAMLDQAWHQLTPDNVPTDALEFEKSVLAKIGLDFAPVPPRYRTTYFAHIFAGGYSAGYYSYLWSEVLDADSVEWFKEKGGLKRENGDWFRKTLLSRGGSVEALDLFKTFRGRDPDIKPLLSRRGLDSVVTHQ